jgi:hypothetical protein
MQRFIFFAIMLFSSAQSFSVISTYTSSNCTAESVVSRTIASNACPSYPEENSPYDSCIPTSLDDGSYFYWNSSYCNSTEVPELNPAWYNVYGFRGQACNFTDPALIMEVASTGEAFPTTAYTGTTLFTLTVSMDCNDNDTLLWEQCMQSNCVNFAIPHATCKQTDGYSYIYQTSCRDRPAPVSSPIASPVTAEPVTSVTPQAGSTPVTRSSSASTLKAIVSIICFVIGALF